MSTALLSPLYARCRLCTGKLQVGDDRTRGVCVSCSTRPEAKRLDQAPPAPPAAPTAPVASAPVAPRAFTPADRSLILRLHAHVATVELLRILNDRLVADLGPAAPRYTLEQLQTAITSVDQPREAQDWAGLRRVIAEARQSGVLERITPGVIDDFATVFQLTPAQVTTLRDVVQHAREDV